MNNPEHPSKTAKPERAARDRRRPRGEEEEVHSPCCCKTRKPTSQDTRGNLPKAAAFVGGSGGGIRGGIRRALSVEVGVGRGPHRDANTDLKNLWGARNGCGRIYFFGTVDCTQDILRTFFLLLFVRGNWYSKHSYFFCTTRKTYHSNSAPDQPCLLSVQHYQLLL